jgi:hypothetical protein
VEELLQSVDPREALEEVLGLLTLQDLMEALVLHGIAQPETLGRVVDVAEVVAGGLAVDTP